LGRQRAPQYEHGDFLLPYLRSANVVDGRLDLSDVKSMNFEPAEQAIFSLADGDVLMTEGSGSAETVGTSAVWRADLPGTICFQNTLLRLRPRVGVTDGRFLAWWARHAHGSGQIAAVSTGANIQHIGADGLKDLRIHLPEIGEQRRIADFLDDRVTRIDQIIAARRRLVDEVASAAEAEWDAEDSRIRQSAPSIPIRRVLRSIADGPFGSSLTSSHYADDGARVIRLGNLGIAEFRDDDRAYIPLDYATQLSAHAVQAGDLLMAGLGDERWPLGRCVVAPRDLGPAIVKADCYRIRLDPRVSHAYAATFLSGPAARSAFMQMARGSTRARLSTDLARAAELPLASLVQQEAYTNGVRRVRERSRSTAMQLEAAVTLLQEYKQSLITAAVTGELDTTTAGSEIPK